MSWFNRCHKNVWIYYYYYYLTQILLRFDLKLKQELKVNKDLIEKVIFIQNQIIVEN